MPVPRPARFYLRIKVGLLDCNDAWFGEETSRGKADHRGTSQRDLKPGAHLGRSDGRGESPQEPPEMVVITRPYRNMWSQDKRALRPGGRENLLFHRHTVGDRPAVALLHLGFGERSYSTPQKDEVKQIAFLGRS